MVRSMTGFGRATSDDDSKRSFSIEIKSVNHRYLDMNIRMPKSMIALEEKMRKIISERLSRGKVDVFINYKSYSQDGSEAKANFELADSYVGCLKEIQKRYSLKDDLSLSLIAKFPDVINLVEKEENIEEIWQDMSKLLDISLNTIIEMREAEGKKLSEDIHKKLNDILGWVRNIEEKSLNVVDAYKQKLSDRLSELIGTTEIDESRIAQEIVIFADKASIDEEIIRLKSHITQMITTLNLNEPIGRKLDFIIQEMNREANTIASKSTDLDITNLVINIKNMIEKIREQIQNIE